MKNLRFALILTTFILSTNLSQADTVYKTIDDNGKVSYSSSPTDKQRSISIDIPPEPSIEAQEAANRRHQQNLKAAEIMDNNRQQRTQNIAEDNRIKREKQAQQIKQNQPEEPQQQGPYYGIPGHGIIVLPARPGIRP